MGSAFDRHSSCTAICLCLLVPFTAAAATLQSRTLEAWNGYVRLTEARIESELQSSSGFLRVDFMKAIDAAKVWGMLKNGKVYIEPVHTLDGEGHEFHLQGGMIHHWYGAIFIPDTKVDSLVRWIQDYDHHSRYFKDVERSKLLSRHDNTFLIYLRLTRTKLVTVHYNTNHKAVYRSHGPGRVSSQSVALKIAEIENAGTPFETEEPEGVDSGFMWRLNSYWRFLERDNGVVVECESVSLSRSIPYGLGWLVRQYVSSVPRESLESVLTSIRDGAAWIH
jgi:hypothetical protein